MCHAWHMSTNHGAPRAAEGPVVLVVEDLQWSDPSTRNLLAFLARSLHRTRVLLVVTARTEELHRYPPVLPFLAELERAAPGSLGA